MAFLQRVLSGLLSIGPCGDCSPAEVPDVKERSSSVTNGQAAAAAQNLQLPDQSGTAVESSKAAAASGITAGLGTEAVTSSKSLERALATAINTGIAEGQQEITEAGSPGAAGLRAGVPVTPQLTRDTLAGASQLSTPEVGSQVKELPAKALNGVAVSDLVTSSNGVAQEVVQVLMPAVKKPAVPAAVAEMLLASEPVWVVPEIPSASVVPMLPESSGAEGSAADAPGAVAATWGNAAFWDSRGYHAEALVSGAELPLAEAPKAQTWGNAAFWAAPAYFTPELVGGAGVPVGPATWGNAAFWASKAYCTPALVAGATAENVPKAAVWGNKALWAHAAYLKQELVGGATLPIENAPKPEVRPNKALLADKAFLKPELVGEQAEA